MDRDNESLEDIRVAGVRIAEHVKGMRLSDYQADRKTQAAVERELTIMGEATTRLSAELRAKTDHIPWTRLIRLRNFYVHGYDRLESEDVWATIVRFIPRVVRLVTPLIPRDEDSSAESEQK